MELVFYLEPIILANRPLMVMPWWHYVNQMAAGLANSSRGQYRIKAVMNEEMFKVVCRGEYAPNVTPIGIPQKLLISDFENDWYAASLAMHQKRVPDATLRQISNAFRHIISETPDLIISFSHVPHLELAFPKVPILHTELGIASRPPFPLSFFLDPQGMAGFSSLNHLRSIRASLPYTKAEQDFVDSFRNLFLPLIEQRNPFTRWMISQRQKFGKLLLVPLENAGGYWFDGNSNFRSEFQYITSVMENAPATWGVVFTTHPEQPKITAETAEYFSSTYPNFLYNPEFESVLAVSQYLLAYIDAVACVSSSVGLQALLWNKPLIALGKSHLNGLSIAEGLSSLHQLNDIPATIDDQLGGTLYWLLTRYSIPDRYIFDGDWLAQYLDNKITFQAEQDSPISRFEVIDEPVKLLRSYQELLIPEIPTPNRTMSAERLRKRLGEVEYELKTQQVTEQNFDQEDYLTNNPDVAKAVQNGLFKSGWEHFVRYGQAEKRKIALLVDANQKGKAVPQTSTQPTTANPEVVPVQLESEPNQPSLSQHSTCQVSIIIPVYNQVEFTEQCLQAIYQNTDPADVFEVIVVDDASTDATPQLLKLAADQYPNLRSIRNQQNNGFAVNCNLGAKLAHGKYLVFLNNDTVPTINWLAEMLKLIRENGEVGIVGSKLVFPEEVSGEQGERIQHCGIAFNQKKEGFHLYKFCLENLPFVNKNRPVQAVTGAALLIPAELFQRVGGFDTGFHNGGEDLDLCFKVRALNYQVMYCATSKIYHYESVTIKSLQTEGHSTEDSNYQRFLAKWDNKIDPDEIDIYRADGIHIPAEPARRIAVVSPLAPIKSGVSDVTQELLPYLAQHAIIDLFVDDYLPSDPEVLACHKIHRIADLEYVNWIYNYDQIIYHIGNNPYHTAIFDAAIKLPGVIVLHEYDSKGCQQIRKTGSGQALSDSVIDFDENFYLRNNPDVAKAVMDRAFNSGKDHYLRFGKNEGRIASPKQVGYATNKQLLQHLFSRSKGVIVHNNHSKEMLQSDFPELPIAVVPLLLSPKAKVSSRADVVSARQLFNISDDTFVIVSLGLIQPHKRNHITLQAFARFVRTYPDSLLVFAGDPIDRGYWAQLSQVVQQYNLQDKVKVTGWVSDDDFFAWICAANVTVNLRYPSRGEESASLIRILGSGKPAIVSKYAQFADIPDNCVIKIDFADEINALANAFAMLASDETKRQEIGQMASQYYQKNNAATLVAQAQFDFCLQVQNIAPGFRFGYAPDTTATILWQADFANYADPSRELVLALDRLGVPIRIQPIGGPIKAGIRSTIEEVSLAELLSMPLASRFVQVYAGSTGSFERHPEAQRVILYTDHLSLSAAAKASIDVVDKIWVPSQYSLDCLIKAGVPAHKLAIVPFGLSKLAYGTTVHQAQVNQSFTFLTMTDWSERSQWENVLLAFLREFGGDPKYQLWIRQLPCGLDQPGRPETQEYLKKFFAKHAEFRAEVQRQIRCDAQPVPQDEVPNLYALGDAFVLPCIDSPFGRPVLEAMAVGVPVITTGQGGQTEYASATNARFANVIKNNNKPSVDVNDLRKQMRWIVEHRFEAQSLGVNGRIAALNGWTWHATAVKALQRLEQIASGSVVHARIRLGGMPIPATDVSIPPEPPKVRSLEKPTMKVNIMASTSLRSNAASEARPSVQNALSTPKSAGVGFNVIGHVSGNLGLGVLARNVISQLVARNYPVAVVDIDPGLERGGFDRRFDALTVRSVMDASHLINLYVLPAPSMGWVLNATQALQRPGSINAALIMWELSVLPPAWVEPLEAIDVIVAQSEFIRHLAEFRLSGIQSIFAPPYLDLPTNITADRKRWGFPAEAVIYMTSFEPYSDVRRKNIDGVIATFVNSVGKQPQAHLVIKVNNVADNPDLKQKIRDMVTRVSGNHPRIHLVMENLSYADVLGLYASADVYVSLHRAEGLGLGLMESMSLGKPVIGTAWSGNLTYMTQRNSCLVGRRLIPVDGTIPAYMKGNLPADAVWADPDLEDAGVWMQRLFQDSALRTEIGQRAKQAMIEMQSDAEKAAWVDDLVTIWQQRQYLPQRTAQKQAQLARLAGKSKAQSAEMPVVSANGKPSQAPAAAQAVVDIVIPVYGQAQLLERCVQSVLRTQPEAHVILVDDCSPGNEIAGLFETWRNHPQITLTRTPQNQGFIGACRVGASLGQSPYILFLNSDTEAIEAGWLDKMILGEDDVAIVGARLIYPPDAPGLLAGTIQHAGVARNDKGIPYHPFLGWPADHEAVKTVRNVNAVTGACYLVRRSVWDQLGGWDARFGKGVYEDVDLCWRVRQKGLRVVYQPAACLIHHESASKSPDGRHQLNQHTRDNLNKLLAKWKPLRSDEAIFFGESTLRGWERGRKHLQRAKDAITQNNHKAARTALEKAIEAAPDNPDILIAMGQMLVMDSRYAEAADFFERALAQSPASWQVRLEYADALYAAGETQRAAIEIMQLLAVFPDDRAVLERAGKLNANIPSPAPATEPAPLPEAVYAMINQANQAAEAQDWVSAQQSIQAALVLAPANSWLLNTLGNLQLQAGDINAALESYASSAEADPSDPQPFISMGMLLLRLEQFEEARQALARAFQLDPQNADVQQLLASLSSPAGAGQPSTPDAAAFFAAALEAEDVLAFLADHPEGVTPELLAVVQANVQEARAQGDDDLAEGLDGLAEVIRQALDAA